jgi:uncharacterized protein YutE (UPF0331/DUF86 family)
MGELLLRKVILIRDHIAKIRGALPPRAEDVTRDERLEAFISFHLFLMMQDALDLATHLISARGLALPGSQREVFESLAKAGLLSRETSQALASLASLRNRIAHAYGDIDAVRMVTEAPAGLVHVEKMLEELSDAITSA